MTPVDSPKRFSVTTICVGIVVGIALLAIAADYWSAKPRNASASYVGRSACLDCHREQSASFIGSHHDKAMAVATPESVRGDFDDVAFEHDGISNRLYRDGERFMVRTEGETGELEDFEVKYVFGTEPLQQYMVEFDRPPNATPDQIGRLQVLRICWDTEQENWFYLRPPDVPEKLLPDDPLHWTGVAQRWQTMCAKCHSTDLQKNFDVKTVSYRTTFSEIDVSCEACHGPGSLHVELANEKSIFWDRNHGYGLATLRGKDSSLELEACAPCHSRRGELTSHWDAGNVFCNHFQLESLQAHTYHDDGQIKDEVYVYGSFLQSKMHDQGIRCSDCHDPHSLKMKHPGNQTCTSCHQHSAGKYDTPSHHHHAVGTEAALCVNCHMPHTTYMEVDPRRDHSLRVPRPDLSVKIGTPNACSGCHVRDRLETMHGKSKEKLNEAEYAVWIQFGQSDPVVANAIAETDRWCDQACEKWYGENRNTPFHFAETLHAFRTQQPGAIEAMLQIACDRDRGSHWVPEIARATLFNELAENRVPLGSQVKSIVPLAHSLENDPMVRAAAVRALGSGPPHLVRKPLLDALEDPSRLVRIAAANTILQSELYRHLRGRERLQVDQVTDREVHNSLRSAADRAAAHLAWAMIQETRGNVNDAVESYQSAMRVEPHAAGARSNLAALLDRIAENETPERAKVMTDRASQLRAEELPLLARDAELAKQNASVQYRYGLALYLNGQLDEAIEKLTEATRLEPDSSMFDQARRLLQEKIDSIHRMEP